MSNANNEGVMAQASVNTTIYVPYKLHQKLRYLKDQRGVSLSFWICKAIEEKMEKDDSQLQIPENLE